MLLFSFLCFKAMGKKKNLVFRTDVTHIYSDVFTAIQYWPSKNYII